MCLILQLEINKYVILSIIFDFLIVIDLWLVLGFYGSLGRVIQ